MLKLIYFVPHSHVETTKEALFAVGAGRIDNYAKCSWQVLGQGQFLPQQGAQPAIGHVGALEYVQE